MKRGQKRAAVGANDRRNDNEPLAARISAALDDHQYLQQIAAAAFEVHTKNKREMYHIIV